MYQDSSSFFPINPHLIYNIFPILYNQFKVLGDIIQVLVSIRRIIYMNYSEIYLFFRPMIKSIVHFITGQTQVQRVSRRKDILALQESIRLSKVLVHYRQNHFTWTQQYSQDLMEELCTLKRIQAADAKFRIGVALNQLFSWKFALEHLNNLRKTKYDANIQQHQVKLMNIWGRLKPKRTLKSRKSQQWIQIGFQAEDPATDFRGSGYLGLIALQQFVAIENGRQIFKIAETPGTQYFFASASIFLTMTTFELIKQLLIPAYIWVNLSSQLIQQQFFKIYNLVFKHFNNFWSEVPDKSMMQFNINLLSFSQLIKNQKLNQLIDDLILQQNSLNGYSSS